MIRLILWDIDGTLIRTDGLGRRATCLALEQVYGTAGAVMTHHFGGKPDLRTLRELLLPEGITEQTIFDLLPQYMEAVSSIMSAIAPDHNVRALPNGVELVRGLHQSASVVQGIVTGNVQTIAPVKLGVAGYDMAWFSVGAYGNESENRADLPIKAIERASVLHQSDFAPHEVLIVGDTVMDVHAARANHLPVCIVRTGYETEEAIVASQPDFILDDLTSFETVLRHFH